MPSPSMCVVYCLLKGPSISSTHFDQLTTPVIDFKSISTTLTVQIKLKQLQSKQLVLQLLNDNNLDIVFSHNLQIVCCQHQFKGKYI